MSDQKQVSYIIKTNGHRLHHLPPIAVERPVTRPPLHRSRRAVFPHRALQEDSLPPVGSHCPPCVSRLRSRHDVRLFYLKVTEQFTEACPRVTLFMAATIQPFEQNLHGLLVELIQAGVVAVDALVVVGPAQFGVQLPEPVRHATPAVLSTPVGELVERVSQFLTRRAPLDTRLASAVSPPAKLKAQKVETGFAHVVLSTERDDTCLFGGQL